MQRRRGQGVAGHRHGRAGDRSRVPGPDRVRRRGWHPKPMALLESIGDPTLTVGLSFTAIYAKAAERRMVGDVLRWSQTVIDLADGDPVKGQLRYRVSVGARLYDAGYRPVWPGPSRMAQTTCATAVAMARSADPLSYATVVAYVYCRGNTDWRAEARRFARCARSRMPCGLPNDPVMISRWFSPGRRWALRWCTATRMRSVTAGRSCWPRSATCFCAGDTT